MTPDKTILHEQTGSWFAIHIANLDELTVCPDIVTNNNAHTINVVPDSEGIKLKPIPESIVITESIKKTKSGPLYIVSATVEFGYQFQEVDYYLEECLLKKVVLFGVKFHGQQKMYGSKKFPLNFKYQYLHGKKVEDGNKIKITISGESPQRPVFIND